MSVDFNKAGLLLHICDLANQWPRLKPLHDAAMAELEKLQAAKEEPAEVEESRR